MNECPTCSRTFETRRGLGVHHVHAHDERLPNRECDACGEPFYLDHSRKYCSETCHWDSVSFEGKENPNYQGKKVATTCDICGEEFEYWPSEKEGRYCTDCVENENWQTTPESLTGSDNPLWGGGKEKRDCVVCGTTIERYPSGFQGEKTFCDTECRSEWLSDEFTREGHPNWKGGGNEPYGKGWARVRARALERDDYECQVCGKTKSEIGRNPDVHHITPVRAFIDSDERSRTDAHRLDNVITLCVTCHRRADFGNISSDELHALIASECDA